MVITNGAKSVSEVIDFFRQKKVQSILLIVLFIAFVFSSVLFNRRVYQSTIHEGDIALKDTYAPYDFDYKWGINVDKTSAAIELARKDVPYYFTLDNSREQAAAENINNFFTYISKLKSSATSDDEKRDSIFKTFEIEFSKKDIDIFLGYDDFQKINQDAIQVTKNIFSIGYLSSQDKALIDEENIRNVVITDPSTKTEINRSVDDIIYEDTLEFAVSKNLDWYFKEEPKLYKKLKELILKSVKPNIYPDKESTNKAREDSVKGVKEIRNEYSVKRNELIIEKGERVSARHVSQISVINDMMKSSASFRFFIGIFIFLFILCAQGIIYIKMTHTENFLSKTRDLSIVLINMAIMVLVSYAVISMPQPSHFIPLASMAMILTLTVGFNLSIIATILMSLFIGVLSGGFVSIVIVLLSGSLAGSIAIRDARKRAMLLLAGLIAGVAKFIAVVSLGLINGIDFQVFLREGLWGIASGVLSGLMVMGLLLIFEIVFKLPTNLSLLEMSDLNHPLLKKLAMEAPGTYHHCIVVGNLAEAACESIGANSLLARIGSYFHDIGKISKPQYFNENELGAKSKHTGLTPSMSALIICKHVKEGVEIANKYKLNEAIIDFIKQHHGTGIISYFYNKAVEKAKDGEVPDQKNFCYPGPRPQTKEAGIVLVCDTLEASSRSLADPTPSSIRNLVRKVINKRFIEGQLDECDLTLKDLHNISEALIRALMGIFHTRSGFAADKAKGQQNNSNGKDRNKKS